MYNKTSDIHLQQITTCLLYYREMDSYGVSSAGRDACILGHTGSITTGKLISTTDTIQYNTIQYNTIQYNTIQYNLK